MINNNGPQPNIQKNKKIVIQEFDSLIFQLFYVIFMKNKLNIFFLIFLYNQHHTPLLAVLCNENYNCDLFLAVFTCKNILKKNTKTLYILYSGESSDIYKTLLAITLEPLKMVLKVR